MKCRHCETIVSGATKLLVQSSGWYQTTCGGEVFVGWKNNGVNFVSAAYCEDHKGLREADQLQDSLEQYADQYGWESALWARANGFV